MTHSLDTNVLIAFFAGNKAVIERMRQHELNDIGVSGVVMHELYFGAFRSVRKAANIARVDALRFDILTFDANDARHAGEIRQDLQAVGTPIGPYDVLIAGQARARGLTLVTHNVREFTRVPGLRVEDWQ